MKIVIDTNVFVSGVFFTGPPHEILQAWREGKLQWVVSPQIFDEYRRVGEVLGEQFTGVALEPILELLIVKAQLILAPDLPGPVCDDPDDDKFLACALAGGAKLIISGDKHLLKVGEYQGVRVLRPRAFIDQYLP